jgi:hypothetical protein
MYRKAEVRFVEGRQMAQDDVCADPAGQQMIFDEIMLHSPPPLRLQHVRIPTDAVEYDLENPRLKYKKQLWPDKSDAELLFDEPDTPWLLKDIAQKGVIEPIYVKAMSSGSWKVIEGNRRAAVMKNLHEKHKGNPLYACIPARLLPPETTKTQEALLMASYHVAGRVKWQPHEKAGHIYYMIHDLKVPESELVATLHMGAPAIKKAAESYALLEKFKTTENGRFAKDAEGKWSFFSEMLKIKYFYEKHKASQEWGDQFCLWVGEKRIPTADDVRRTLPQVLKNRKAKDLFENEPADVAWKKASKEVDKSSPARTSKFYRDLEHLIESCKAANLEELQAPEHNEAARDLVLEGYEMLTRFMDKAGVRPMPRRVA